MLELEHEFRIVDVNARLTPEDIGKIRERGREISPDRLERELHQAGIVRAIVSSTPIADANLIAANNSVARFSVDRPFVPFARINGPKSVDTALSGQLSNVLSRRRSTHTSPADVEQYAYDDRFYGFTLDPAIDGVPDSDVIDQLDAVGLPILINGGVDAPPTALAEQFFGRSFPVIVAHFGGYPLNSSLMNEMIDLLDQYDECYVDTSFVRYRTQLERALREHPDRVFFGSGAPACHPNVAVMEILTLDVSEDKLWRAFAKNACRVIEALAPHTEG